MHYYKFNIGDWHLATSHLTLEEEAIYFKLINFYYDSERPIPVETDSVIRRLRLGSVRDTVGIVLQEFFVLQDDGWHHLRCDDEISKYHHKAEVNQRIGKLGGRPKKTETVSVGIPEITLTTNHKPITNNHISTPEGVTESVWNDYLKIRKAAKKPITETALKGLVREAGKAGKTLNDALVICCERSWLGFKAEWLKGDVQQVEKVKFI
jgi:uncharacterized protein YdaU (DUF1376 family)